MGTSRPCDCPNHFPPTGIPGTRSPFLLRDVRCSALGKSYQAPPRPPWPLPTHPHSWGQESIPSQVCGAPAGAVGELPNLTSTHTATSHHQHSQGQDSIPLRDVQFSGQHCGRAARSHQDPHGHFHPPTFPEPGLHSPQRCGAPARAVGELPGPVGPHGHFPPTDIPGARSPFPQMCEALWPARCKSHQALPCCPGGLWTPPCPEGFLQVQILEKHDPHISEL